MNCKYFLALGALFILIGCAHTPDVEVNYYLPKTDITLHIVRTVACDAQKNVITASTVTASVTHSADFSASSRKTIALKTLDGTFSDTDFQLQLYEDGRLKSINDTTTGEAEAAIKPLITIATAALGASVKSQDTTPKDACSFSPDPTKPLSVTFTQSLDFQQLKGTDSAGGEITTANEPIPPDTDSTINFTKVQSALGYVCVRMTKLLPAADAKGQRPPYAPAQELSLDANRTVELQLRQPALLSLEVWPSVDKDCQTFEGKSPLWTGFGEVAQLGTDYTLPMPKAELFGKLQFSLAVAESGAVTTLQYTKLSGASSMTETAGAIATAATPESDAQKAADLKAEGDIIAQQQRDVRCRAKPTACT